MVIISFYTNVLFFPSILSLYSVNKLKMYQTNIIQCICNCKRNIVKERKIDFHQLLYFVEDLLQNSDYTRGCWQWLGKDEDGMSTIHQYFNIKAEI